MGEMSAAADQMYTVGHTTFFIQTSRSPSRNFYTRGKSSKFRLNFRHDSFWAARISKWSKISEI